MSSSKTISLMFSGVDNDAVVSQALHSITQIWDAPISNRGARISINIPGQDMNLPVVFQGSTLFVFDASRICIAQKNQDGDAIWSNLLNELRTYRPLACREDRPLIFLFLNAHKLSEVNLMKLRAFIEVCYTERLIWMGWDPRQVCPKSIVSRFVVLPIQANVERINECKELLKARIQSVLVEIGIENQAKFRVSDKEKFLLNLRKVALRLMCLPIDMNEILGVLFQMFPGQGMEAIYTESLKMTSRGLLLPHLALEQFILKVCEGGYNRASLVVERGD